MVRRGNLLDDLLHKRKGATHGESDGVTKRDDKREIATLCMRVRAGVGRCRQEEQSSSHGGELTSKLTLSTALPSTTTPPYQSLERHTASGLTIHQLSSSRYQISLHSPARLTPARLRLSSPAYDGTQTCHLRLCVYLDVQAFQSQSFQILCFRSGTVFQADPRPSSQVQGQRHHRQGRAARGDHRP
jgi:hypothetical protein